MRVLMRQTWCSSVCLAGCSFSALCILILSEMWLQRRRRRRRWMCLMRSDMVQYCTHRMVLFLSPADPDAL